MNKKYFATIVGAALTLGIVSCSDDDDINNGGNNQEYNPGKIEMTSSQLATVAKCNSFGFTMLNAIGSSEEFAGKNIILSPISFNYAFSMLANGANGETREQIINALGYDAVSVDELNDINQKLTHELSTLDAKVTLNFANSIWTKPNIQVNKDFISTLLSVYDAEVKKIDSNTFVNDINEWCSSKTNGKISDFMPMSSSVPEVAIFNATYFKGIWSSYYKFDRSKTTTGYFNDIDGTRSETQFMKQRNAFVYSKTSNMQKCELSFGNSSFCVAFILPNDGVSLSQTVENLANGEWEQLCEYYIPEDQNHIIMVDLSLPKFKIETEITFDQFVADLAMPDVFQPTSDYSNIAEGIHFDTAKQKSTFEIDEEGAVAAAVTGEFQLSGSGTLPYKEVSMTFDRPFIYVVYEHSTGVILFAGCVNSFNK